MFQFDPSERLPTAAELPDSDRKPVDSELQIDVPGLLAASLALAWATRDDWFFGKIWVFTTLRTLMRSFQMEF